jgi:hypothetical protein
VSSVVFFDEEMSMRTKTIKILLLLGSGVWPMQALLAAPAEPPADAVATDAVGVKYEHRLEVSRFDVGNGMQHQIEGPLERVVGAKGAFLIDRITGASLAVRNAPILPKPPVNAEKAVNGAAAQSPSYPQPLTDDAGEHSAVVRAYLVAAGLPQSQVSGGHVTTTMAGRGRVNGGVLESSQAKLLWYTTHLERSVGGIPVDGSYAFAALDRAGGVITEGVYWPAIPAKVIYKAQTLAERLVSPHHHAAFLEQVRSQQPEVGDAVGTVKIVHTSSGHHGTFEAHAVYEIVTRGAGKAKILRFDDTGAQVRMVDELRSGIDSIKRR